MDKQGHHMVTHGCVNQKKTKGRKGQVTATVHWLEKEKKQNKRTHVTLVHRERKGEEKKEKQFATPYNIPTTHGYSNITSNRRRNMFCYQN